MTINKKGSFDNGILNFVDPLHGYSEEEIISLKEPTVIELGFWRGGERFKAIKMYAKRNKLDDKIDLVVWFFLSMNFLATQILKEQEKFLDMRKKESDLLDPSDI